MTLFNWRCFCFLSNQVTSCTHEVSVIRYNESQIMQSVGKYATAMYW
jgi:hypothetical protein